MIHFHKISTKSSYSHIPLESVTEPLQYKVLSYLLSSSLDFMYLLLLFQVFECKQNKNRIMMIFQAQLPNSTWQRMIKIATLQIGWQINTLTRVVYEEKSLSPFYTEQNLNILFKFLNYHILDRNYSAQIFIGSQTFHSIHGNLISTKIL